MIRPKSVRDLLPSERRFLAAMNELGFARLEGLRIERGELVLDPWPKTVRSVKFGSEAAPVKRFADDSELKRQIVDLFVYVRGIEAGEICSLEIRYSLPFSMEIVCAAGLNRAYQPTAS